ncbi:MAG: ATP-dependent Clp protease adaptor ClpS [Prolixibacteraceae bacterium]|jgi:ATP-dependent Clp protease adaptor protein ClpS|nr:ATP-dependent Clp protease adaptor ClpS [Prolixibacteraceae bacterium]MBT6005993.1 ATP-dependent Clp protease adaptor ClpS [Prolixibacteraceae bacterium]MBT6765702.1 ATP-dependent Clp protease adaptor ClpS [Prolixibacteraceae bacterium]MBT6997475.1 ATP-dependent Clp protease adaptor ClpS [Prolixibacteraceae bacterium]MBT7396063.1 ATP-dependent Clp protease adaptor ClpS [Prolixibacteraceae bacterium]
MTSKETKKKPTENIDEGIANDNFLILHNDDVHSFDYVINALIDVCEHGYEQAAQCTLIVHYKGKCDVKKGGFKILKPLKEALIERKLNATID